MQMNTMRRLLCLLSAIAALGAWPSSGAAAEPKPGDTTGTILETSSYWRCLFAYSPPVVRKGGGVETLGPETKQPSVALSAEWMQPDFADQSWGRRPGPFFSPPFGFSVSGAGSPNLGLIRLRGYFEVRDPATTAGMAVSISYRGGVVLYLNGKELARGNLPTGAIQPETLAEDYPLESFFADDACTKGISWGYGEPEKFKSRLVKRIRSLEGIEIPVAMLRQGTNVLAVEIHRAAFPEAWAKLAPREQQEKAWASAGLISLSLKAAEGSPSMPSAGRPRGLQVWNADVHESVFETDYGAPGVALGPVRLVSPISGRASGQIVLSSDRPLQGLKVEVSDLKGPTVLPAARVQVRYAREDGTEGRSGLRYQYPADPLRFDVLLEVPPQHVPVKKLRVARYDGAVQPVWVTVSVPAEALAGDYEGSLALAAEGMPPVRVPVHLKVCAWKAPGLRHGAVFVDLIQSPESVALQYGVPLWSDKHFALMGKSCRLLGAVGCKVVYLPLIAESNLGNSESMVRWIKGADGGYRQDFSLVDRYLDLWEKEVGKPEVVCLYAWELFAGGAYMGGATGKNAGVSVSVVDPQTGKTEVMETAPFGTPESEKFWQPVFDQLRAKLNRRGMTDEHIMIGIASDVRPGQAVSDFFYKIAPYAKWVLEAHAGPNKIGAAEVGYMTHVWNIRGVPDPDVTRYYGWKTPARRVAFLREGCKLYDALHRDSPLAAYRVVCETMLMSDQRGIGRLGADFWPVLRDGRGNAYSISARYPKTSWAQLNLSSAALYILAPGPDGALATARFEMLREGLQEAEARVVIEKALTDPAAKTRLGEELTARCQGLLDERARWIVTVNRERNWGWFPGPVWQQRAEQLFAAAGEATAKLSGK
jgi:hypothetical protein